MWSNEAGDFRYGTSRQLVRCSGVSAYWATANAPPFRATVITERASRLPAGLNQSAIFQMHEFMTML
jgi:hypothetical protein